MSRTLLRFSRIVLLCAAGTSLAAQQPPAQRAVEAEATNVTAIVVDVVVRDKQGNPIQGLTADDFQIFEDGVPQDLGSLTAVSKPPVTPVTQPGAATTVAGAPGEPVGEAAKKAPEVLALVFDRLSADGRALAFNAANQYIGQGKVVEQRRRRLRHRPVADVPPAVHPRRRRDPGRDPHRRRPQHVHLQHDPRAGVAVGRRADQAPTTRSTA